MVRTHITACCALACTEGGVGLAAVGGERGGVLIYYQVVTRLLEIRVLPGGKGWLGGRHCGLRFGVYMNV